MPKNPADVQRKLERKRELQRNKKQREQSREVMQMRNDPARMRGELLRLEQLERAGNLDNAMRPAKLRLAEAYRQALLRNPNAAETKAAPASASSAKTLAEPPKKKKTAAAAAAVPTTTAATAEEESFFEDAREIAETAAALSSGMVPLALRVKRQRPLTAAAAAAEPRVPSSDDAPAKATEDSTGGEDKEMEAFMAEMREIGAIE